MGDPLAAVTGAWDWPVRECYGGPFDGLGLPVPDGLVAHVWRDPSLTDGLRFHIGPAIVVGRTADGWGIVQEAPDPAHVGVYAIWTAASGLLKWFPDPVPADAC